jgi:tetratricopeptide (TPR) repeat protein
VKPGFAQAGGCVLLAFAGGLFAGPTMGAAELNQRGVDYLNKGEYSRALVQFRAAASLRPKDPAIQFNVGLTLVRMGRLREALGPLGASLTHTGSAGEARYLRGVVLFQLGEFASASSELEPLRSGERNGEQVLYMLVESSRNSGDAQRSRQAFIELETRYPQSPLLNKLMGIAYEWQGNGPKASEEFLEAYRKNPRMPDIAFAIGYLHFKQRGYEEAREWFGKELSLDPCYAKAHHYLGQIEAAAGGLPTAAAHYRRAIACEPGYSEPYLGLGKVLEGTGDVAQAVKHYRQAVKLSPRNRRGHYVLGLALRRSGRRGESDAELAIARGLGEEESERMPLLTRPQN